MSKTRYALFFCPLLIVVLFWTSAHFFHFSFLGFFGPYEVVGIAKQGTIGVNVDYEGGFAAQIFPVVAEYDEETDYFAITQPSIEESLLGSNPEFEILMGGLIPKNILITLPLWMITLFVFSLTFVAILLLRNHGPNRVGTGIEPAPPHHPACGVDCASLAATRCLAASVSLRSAAPGGSHQSWILRATLCRAIRIPNRAERIGTKWR